MALDLAKLRALAEAATPGPWRHSSYGIMGFEEAVVSWRYAWEDSEERNRPFIVAADPPTVLALIAEIERLEAERDARPAITAEDARGWADAREAFYEPTLDEKAAWERVDDTLHAHAKKAVSRTVEIVRDAPRRHGAEFNVEAERDWLYCVARRHAMGVRWIAREFRFETIDEGDARRVVERAESAR